MNSTQPEQDCNQERQADKVKASHESQRARQHVLSVGNAQAQVSRAVPPSRFRASVLLGTFLSPGSNAQLGQSYKELHLGQRLK